MVYIYYLTYLIFAILLIFSATSKVSAKFTYCGKARCNCAIYVSVNYGKGEFQNSAYLDFCDSLDRPLIEEKFKDETDHLYDIGSKCSSSDFEINSSDNIYNDIQYWNKQDNRKNKINQFFTCSNVASYVKRCRRCWFKKKCTTTRHVREYYVKMIFYIKTLIKY